MSPNLISKFFVFTAVVSTPLMGFANTAVVNSLPPAVKAVVASGVQRNRTIGLVVSGDAAQDLGKALQAVGPDTFTYKTYVQGDNRPGFSSKLFFIQNQIVVIPFFNHKTVSTEAELPGNNISEDVITLGKRTIVYGEIAAVINEGIQNLKQDGVTLSNITCTTHAFHSNGESTGDVFSACDIL